MRRTTFPFKRSFKAVFGASIRLEFLCLCVLLPSMICATALLKSDDGQDVVDIDNEDSSSPTDRVFVDAFSNVYKTNSWGNGSGPGSYIENARPYVHLLQTYFDARFCMIVDFGNGDWQIMRHIAIPSHNIYTGFDLVSSVQIAGALAATTCVSFSPVACMRT